MGFATWRWCGGRFVDGSGGRGVYGLLKADGFNVSVVENLACKDAGRRRTRALTPCVPTAHQFLQLLLGVEHHLRRCRVLRD